jgi:mRNA-degrading endonuclease YafQ of YafQ-DinJ toxin-antitoxin module
VAKIIYTESDLKRAKNFFNKHPEIIGQYEKTLRLLETNPFHPSLRLHKLKDALSDLYSVSINITYRLTLEFVIDENTIVPIDIGSHRKVY